MSDIAETIEALQRGVNNFQAEMRERQIHVGMKSWGKVRCVCCGDDWPCAGSVGEGTR